MKMIHSEKGSSLVNTLAVLVVIFLLLVTGMIMYDDAVDYYKKVKTIEEISEVAARYQLQPVACTEKTTGQAECSVSLQALAPDMTHVGPYAVATADGGRVSITRSETPGEFTLAAYSILDTTCVAALEGNFYETVMVDCKFTSRLNIPSCAPGDKLLLGRNYLQQTIPEDLRNEIIKDVCSTETGQVDMTGYHWGNDCDDSSHSYFYTGTAGCGGCPGNLVEDKKGNCCTEVNACGYCKDKGHCVVDVVGCAEDKEVCLEDTKKCVECTKNEHCSECIDSTTHKKKERWICSNNHCCPPGQKYINGHCTCEGGGVYCDETCCTSAQSCITRGTGDAAVKTCCDDTGETGSSCATNDCCGEGLRCNNGRCCSATTFGHGETCVECLSNNGSGEEGACPTKEAPICDKSTANYHCVECLGGKVWTENADHTWSCQCPTGKFENSAGVCVDCLVNYGKGTGQCTDIKFPVCDNKGETATWTCKECPPETPWNGETCGCPSGTYYSSVKEECVKCLWSVGQPGSEGKNGICSNATPICDNKDKTTSWTCDTCVGRGYDEPIWKASEQKCVCYTNYDPKGEDTNACTDINFPACSSSSGGECQKCSDLTPWWNGSVRRCVECLVDHGKGTGACTDSQKPICRTSGDNAWTCGPCPGNKKWTKNTTTGTWSCQCPTDKPYDKGEDICVECLADLGSDEEGACTETTAPICNNAGTNPTWECISCREANSETPWWSGIAKRCVECLADFGSNEEGACMDSTNRFCDNKTPESSWKCTACDPGTFWNDEAGRCTECLHSYDGTTGDGVCPATTPVCNNEGPVPPWTCGPCPEPKLRPWWNKEIQKCVCLANYSTGDEGACTDEQLPYCHRTGNIGTCMKCLPGTFWNSITKTCTECLQDYGGTENSGYGACLETKPICDSEGENATWTCKCPPEKPFWNGSKCTCPSGLYWSDVKESCVKCLLHYGQTGVGACLAVSPKCDNKDETTTWTCGECEADKPYWDTSSLQCICKYNNGEADGADGECPVNKPYCDKAGTKTCGTCPSGFWNSITHTCTDCLDHFGSGATGACSTINNPVCDNEGANAEWTCGPCPEPEDAPWWSSQEQKCVCLANYGTEKTGACINQNKPYCDKAGTNTCGDCPTGTYWNPAKHDCTKCVYNYGEKKSGSSETATVRDGACPSDTPKCDKQSTWTCGVCSGDTPVWDSELQRCVCKANYGSDVDGACPTKTKPICDSDTKVCIKCPNGYWNDETKTCTSCLWNYDGTNKDGVCQDKANPRCVKGTSDWTCQPCPNPGETWEFFQGAWQCVLKCDNEHTSAECCKEKYPNYVYKDGHCCPSTKLWNTTAGMCTSCLRSYGLTGDGACQDIRSPRCVDETTDWTCKPCPNNGEIWYEVSTGNWQCVQASCTVGGTYGSLPRCRSGLPKGTVCLSPSTKEFCEAHPEENKPYGLCKIMHSLGQGTYYFDRVITKGCELVGGTLATSHTGKCCPLFTSEQVYVKAHINVVNLSTCTGSHRTMKGGSDTTDSGDKYKIRGLCIIE